MEPGCKLEDFGRLAQPAASNRLRCRVNGVSERYLDETLFRWRSNMCLTYAWFTCLYFLVKTFFDVIVWACCLCFYSFLRSLDRTKKDRDVMLKVFKVVPNAWNSMPLPIEFFYTVGVLSF
jgi:hypothetical protein